MRATSWVFLLACLPWTGVRAAPPPLSAYASLPTGVSARLSPDGSAVAMIGASGGKPAFVVVHLDGSPPRVFSTGGWAPRWIEWKGPGQLLAGVLGTTDNWNTHTVISATRLLLLAGDGSRARPVETKQKIFDGAVAGCLVWRIVCASQ